MLPLTVISLPTDIELSISPVDAYYDTNSNNIEDVKRTKRAGSFNFIGAISNVSYEFENEEKTKQYFVNNHFVEYITFQSFFFYKCKHNVILVGKILKVILVCWIIIRFGKKEDKNKNKIISKTYHLTLQFSVVNHIVGYLLFFLMLLVHYFCIFTSLHPKNERLLLYTFTFIKTNNNKNTIAYLAIKLKVAIIFRVLRHQLVKHQLP